MAPQKAIPPRVEVFPLTEENPTKDILEEEADKIFGRLSSKALKISELLSAFALPPISELVKREYKNVWHIQYDPTAIAKAAVYKELIGIISCDTLVKYLKRYPEEAKILGFNEDKILGHRTFSRCFIGKVGELAKWVAWKIRDAADEKAIRVIDPRSVVGEKKLKKDEIKKICRVAEKHIFPLINISSEYHNPKYSNEDMLNLLLHAAMTNDFAEDASNTLKESRPNWNVPNADTLLYHIKYHTKYGKEKKERSKEEIERIFINAFDTIFKMAKKHNPKLFKGKKDVAIDFTDWLFYGKSDTEMVTGTKPTRGTSWAYKFGSINIVENGTRFTLLALPVSSELERGEEMLRVTEKLIKYAIKKIEIDRVYADKWFYNVKFIKILGESNTDFVIQVPLNKRINKILEDNKDKDTIVIEDFKLKDKTNKIKEKANFFAVKKRLFNVSAKRFEDELNKGVISEELRTIFKTKGSSLSEAATVIKENGEWRITDIGKIYSIKKAKGKLNVYRKSENNGDEKVCFITSLDVDEKSANQCGELFRRRWGIETSYRVEGDFKPKTTSKNPIVRLYYFFFSVCMYNLWVIVNMILSIVLGLITGKPLITAKRLIVLLQMSMVEKPPP